MEKLFLYLTSVYRFIVVFLVIGMHYKISADYDQKSLAMYAALFLYALAFSLLKTKKWVGYLDLLAILGLLYYYQQNMLYFLVIVPFTHIASSKANKWDIVLFTAIVALYAYFQVDNTLNVALTALGFFIALVIFHNKYNQIEYLENRLFQEKEHSQELKKELNGRNLEIEITSKMFAKSNQINETTDTSELTQLLVNSAKEFFNAYYACLYINNNSKFEKTHEAGKNEKYDAPQTISAEEGDDIIIKNDVLQIPVEYEKQDWGVIRVYGKRGNIGDKGQTAFYPFEEMDYETMLLFADKIMNRVKELTLSEKNEFLANNDFLTGIPNRRYFINRYDHFAELAKRGEEFSMLLLDIDHFKLFNDRFGHEIGDSVLIIVAQTLEDAVRKVDVVGRLGGEEFGVLLLNPKEQSREVAERIRRIISLLPTQSADRVTVSVGLAHFGKDGKTWEELYFHADKALYAAKKGGRNQVVEFHADLLRQDNI